MARSRFGGGPGDTVVSLFQIGSRQILALPADASGTAVSVSLTVWTAPVAGTQITDLLAANGVTAISTITVPTTGQIPVFYGPDAVTDLWLKDPEGDFTLLTYGGATGAQGTPGPGSAAWTAAQAVSVGSVRQAPDGSWIKSNAARTTGATFDATEQAFWPTVLATAATLERVALDGRYVPFGGTTVLADNYATLTAALAALTTLSATGGTVILSAASYTTTATLALGENQRLLGAGKYVTKILHGFNGDFATMGQGASIEDLTVDGQGATYTGRGLVFNSTNGSQSANKAKVFNFDGFCLDFAVGAGSLFHSYQLDAWRISAGNGTGRYAINVADTLQAGAVPRSFVQYESGGQCSFSFGGANNMHITDSTIADFLFSVNTQAVTITGSRCLGTTTPLLFRGANSSLVANDIYPKVELQSGADGNVIGPNAYQFVPVDNSGNDRNQVHHAGYTYTPTLASGGTAPVLGNGTIIGHHTRAGQQVTVFIELTLGSTTTLGTGGLRFGLPRARFNTSVVPCGGVMMQSGGSTWTATAIIPENVAYCEAQLPTAGQVSFNSPATFTTGNTIRLMLTYTL